MSAMPEPGQHDCGQPLVASAYYMVACEYQEQYTRLN